MRRTIFLGLGLIAAGFPGLAQDPEAGAETYATFCAACHGETARGDGPVADLLTVPATDLTRLAELNGGSFPLIEVIYRIDGRAPIKAHGSPMPPFGGMFEGEDATMKTEAGQPVLTSRSIVDLVAYLQSVQG